MKTILAGVVVMLLAVLFVAQIAPAQSVSSIKTQLQTAAFHSGELAQRGTVLAGPLLHLQHVVNCLEGTNGPNFRAAAGHVCQGQGNGIIPDLKAAQAAGVRGADKARKFADIALTLSLQMLQSKD
ncbi:MAG: hypothetical protein HYU43_09570, partial [Armatimonadetes bacterium]|nr:hypothetical protein [Armatimonadota bacterium]